jgi:integrase/recombinase XerC
MQIGPLLGDFLRHIELERNLSRSTVAQYACDLNHWLAYLEASGVPADTDAITVQVMRRWLQDMADSGRQPPTTNRNLSAVRSFWRFAGHYHGVEHDSVSPLVSPITDRRLPETLRRSEVMRLFEACDLSHYQFHRVCDRAVVAILACLGLRRQELVDVQVQDFNPENRTLLVRTAKRGRERLVPLTDDLVSLIADWLVVRPQCERPNLFLTRHATPLSPKGLGTMLKRLAKQAGLQRKPRLHMFRHYAGTAMVQQSGIEQARRLLGHQSPETTALYTHLNGDDLRPAVGEAAALSGIGGRNGWAETPVNLDGTTQLALGRLVRSLADLPAGWRESDEVLHHLVTTWAAEAATGNEAARPAPVVAAILWDRETVRGLSFDDHVRIADFGDVVGRLLVTCEGARPRLDRLLAISEELRRGLSGPGHRGDGLDRGDLVRVAEMLNGTKGDGGPVGSLVLAARLANAMEPFRIDVLDGDVAAEMFAGLTVWAAGLPVLIVPAAERSLWRLLQHRLLAGDPLPLVPYGVAKLRSVADGIHAFLGRG